ncbi:MAG TPA: hypothetical protein VH054_02270, partial [Polyangiaceae bacterium]|nr:hypothetical protein [Polyangiaceae bacterium]
MALSLCSSCNRHVRGDDCPFCGAASERTSEIASRIRTAVVIAAGVAAIASTACAMGGYGGPPPEMQNATP